MSIHEQIRQECKDEVLKWANQIGVYNEGCMCPLCMQNIQDKIEGAIKRFIDRNKQLQEHL